MSVVLFISLSPASAQAPDDPEFSLPPDSGQPAASNYYEARVTAEGYALYVPFYIPAPPVEPGATASSAPDAPPESEGGSEEEGAPVRGGFAVRTREEIVPGEFIQVYRPAVYAIDEEGRTRLVEPEATVTLPKVRIVMERVWFGTAPAGTEAGEPEPVEAEPGQTEPVEAKPGSTDAVTTGSVEAFP
jgi:hypothetical protein